MAKKRIVVTGLGWVTPFGCDLNQVFNSLYEGKTAIKRVKDINVEENILAENINADAFDLTDIYCKIAAQVSNDEDIFPVMKWKKALPGGRAGKFILYGLEAAERALLDANLIQEEAGHVDPNLRIGVIAGSGIGGLNETYETSKLIIERGANRVSPFFVPSALINLFPGHISIRHKIKGPNQSQVTACSTGAIAIEDGSRMINEGRCDIVLAGAAESAVGRLGLAGFSALKALAHGFNDLPEEASRPFDKKRAGFVMGDGASMLILEEYEHAKKRGAKIYCEYLGAGLSNDANHITAPCADGSGAISAINDALNQAGKAQQDIDYINAHATSTPVGDAAEMKAFKAVFGQKDRWNKLAISSTKGAIGHMLGAAGSTEAIATILSLHKQKLLPTLNLQDPDDSVYLENQMPNLIPSKGIEAAKLDIAMSTSFGFGGHNVALLFQKIK